MWFLNNSVHAVHPVDALIFFRYWCDFHLKCITSCPNGSWTPLTVCKIGFTWLLTRRAIYHVCTPRNNRRLLTVRISHIFERIRSLHPEETIMLELEVNSKCRMLTSVFFFISINHLIDGNQPLMSSKHRFELKSNHD